MSMSNTTENAVLKAILQGTDPSWRAGANQYLALFTSDPGETASLAAEADYTGYARVSLTKSGAWTDGGSTFTNAALIGILDAIGSASVSLSVAPTVLGAEASAEGAAVLTMTASASMLPTNDAPPERTASASFAISGTMTPYAVGNMVGTALPYTELSPQSLASAVWNYEQ